MFFVVRSDDSFNFQLGWIKYIVIVIRARKSCSVTSLNVLSATVYELLVWSCWCTSCLKKERKKGRKKRKKEKEKKKNSNSVLCTKRVAEEDEGGALIQPVQFTQQKWVYRMRRTWQCCYSTGRHLVTSAVSSSLQRIACANQPTAFPNLCLIVW